MNQAATTEALQRPRESRDRRGEHAFIGRQPVVACNQDIIGYELLHRRDSAAGGAGIASSHDADPELAADALVIANTLTNMGTEWLLGDKLAFINVSPSALMSGFADLLRPDRVVLEIASPLSPTAAAHLAALRTHGFRMCLNEVNGDYAPALGLVDYVKLDVQARSGPEFSDLVASLRPAAKNLIAKRVETVAQFEACRALGVYAFQGYYFARPETCRAKIINASHANLVMLMQLARAHAEFPEIEIVLKRDVAISFKLLRYVNAPGSGLSSEVKSFRQALTVLGYEKLYRWLSLLLMTAEHSRGGVALTRTAVTRGRMAELLGAACFAPSQRDDLFIVGMFSLLDAMLEMPMAEIQEQLRLPQDISDALLTRSGVYGPFINLVEACESGDFLRLATVASELQISASICNRAHLDALAYTESLGLS